MRRRIRNEFAWQGSWVQTNQVEYVYDGNLVIQERDINNLPTVTYTRGKDLSGSLGGAGGIGGLLARTAQAYADAPLAGHSFYHCDGNGNITMLIDSSQGIVAKYLYDAFGNTISLSGLLANANVYRFSSKEWHQNSGLAYYLYRYYDPNLQRWPNRDPKEERGGINLFEFVQNNPISHFDSFGLTTYTWSVPRCGAGLYTAVIQVIEGSGSYGNIVDDGNHGPRSDKAACPPLYPGVDPTPPGDSPLYEDTPGGAFGNTFSLTGNTFEVCRVCLAKCNCMINGPHQSAPAALPGYRIVSIGPCRSFTIPSPFDSVDLDLTGYVIKSATPSAAFTKILSAAYPTAAGGGCFQCNK
jgi:RHS repeat-associated protein